MIPCAPSPASPEEIHGSVRVGRLQYWNYSYKQMFVSSPASGHVDATGRGDIPVATLVAGVAARATRHPGSQGTQRRGRMPEMTSIQRQVLALCSLVSAGDRCDWGVLARQAHREAFSRWSASRRHSGNQRECPQDRMGDQNRFTGELDNRLGASGLGVSGCDRRWGAPDYRV